MKSNAMLNVATVDIAMNQHPLCKSWWSSNSFRRISSALKARTVDKPVRVADKCVNAGDFAVQLELNLITQEIDEIFNFFYLLLLNVSHFSMFLSTQFGIVEKIHSTPRLGLENMDSPLPPKLLNQRDLEYSVQSLE